MTQNAKGPAEAATSPDRGSKFLEGIPMNGSNHNTDAAVAPALSRRRFMAIATAGTAATLPAVALAEASGKTSRLPQQTEPNEHPWEKVRRLSDELSLALSETDGARWFATVFPASDPDYMDFPIQFRSISAHRCADRNVSHKLVHLIAWHRETMQRLDLTCDETDSVLIGKEPTKAALRRHKAALRIEQRAFNEIIAYVPPNDVSRAAKADYLKAFTRHSQLSDVQIDILLNSMCGRCSG